MNRELEQVDATLVRLTGLARELPADPDGHVRRSVEELRAAFTARGAIEPAMARVRDSMDMLHAGNHEAVRGKFQRRAPGLDHLADIVEQDLLPDLRRLGFEV